MKMFFAVLVMLTPLPARAQTPPAPTDAPVSADPAAAHSLAPEASAAPASSEDYDVVKTTDGQVLVGKILRETATGYLFRTGDGQTLVVEFSRIADLRSTKSQGPPPVHASGKSAGADLVPQVPAQGQPPPERATVLDGEITRLNASYRSQFNAGLSLGGGLLFVGAGAVGLACCVDNNPSVQTTSIVAVVTGGVLAVVGGIMLGVNASHNSGVDEEIRKLELERKLLQQQSAFGDESQVAFSLLTCSASF